MRKTKYLLSILLVMALLLGGCASFSPEPEKADNGENMTVVATSVAICEILDSLGYDNVVGVPETSGKLPQRYASVKTVGSPMSPDLEIIKSIAPDLVLSPKSLENSLSQSYSTAGITSAFLDLSSVEGMYSAIASLGELLGCKENADKMVEEYQVYMESYSAEVKENQSVLILMAFPDGFYLVATENSYVGNLVKLAGGSNVYGSDYKGDENGFVSINPEDIVQKNPDRIMVYAHYSQDDAFAYMEKEFEENSSWQYFEAVEKGRITYLPSEYFGMSASLDWTEALQYLKPVFTGEE